MSQSAIAHDGIFGFGDEKQNILAEKEFEEAAAKGSRPCTSTNHHPLFPPSPVYRIPSWSKELCAFVRSEKNHSHSAKEKKPVLLVPSTSTAKVACHPPPPLETVELSSDDDMPDFKQILAQSKKDEAHPPLPRSSFRHLSCHRVITRISERFIAISTSPYTPHQRLVRSVPPAFRDDGQSFRAPSAASHTYILNRSVHHHFVLISVNTPTTPQPILSRLRGVIHRTWRHRSHILFIVNQQPPLKPRYQTRA
ncbi:hypothetical protein F5888DRAFT_1864757 [Russula emetica]|nr:hypothetical protein F5888DRAFT_1864757 [Russula emetica]